MADPKEEPIKDKVSEKKKKTKKKKKNKQNKPPDQPHNRNPPDINNNNISNQKNNNINNINNEGAIRKRVRENDTDDKQKKDKKKKKDVFPFGNYRNYYGYRIGQEMDEDPRLKVLKKEWFQGKVCLDVGCNSGIITIHIAQKFCCRSILGVDIDSERIGDAYWNLRKFVRELRAFKSGKKTSMMKISEKVKFLNHDLAASSVETKDTRKHDSPSEEIDLTRVVSFKQENFVQSWHPPEKFYDTILCLSVTKWVHLNWGDEGLISLFSKIWKLLNPGGILVLEPQPWKSYHSNRLVSETTAMNYRTIMFRPENFQEILLDKIGFRFVEDITSGLSGSKVGFDRPIFAFHK